MSDDTRSLCERKTAHCIRCKGAGKQPPGKGICVPCRGQKQKAKGPCPCRLLDTAPFREALGSNCALQLRAVKRAARQSDDHRHCGAQHVKGHPRKCCKGASWGCETGLSSHVASHAVLVRLISTLDQGKNETILRRNHGAAAVKNMRLPCSCPVLADAGARTGRSAACRDSTRECLVERSVAS